MPIYAYRCDSCGVEKDVLQKLSEQPLTVCPECGAGTFRKQLSAPAFQLKGSGWYVTDFRDNGKKAPAAEGGAAGQGAGQSSDGAAAPAPAPAPAAAAAPAAASGASSASGASGGSTGGTTGGQQKVA